MDEGEVIVEVSLEPPAQPAVAAAATTACRRGFRWYRLYVVLDADKVFHNREGVRGCDVFEGDLFDLGVGGRVPDAWLRRRVVEGNGRGRVGLEEEMLKRGLLTGAATCFERYLPD